MDGCGIPAILVENHRLARDRDRCGTAVDILIFIEKHIEQRIVGIREQKLDRHPIFVAERSEEHTSELQSLMSISYAVVCLKQKIHTHTLTSSTTHTLEVT